MERAPVRTEGIELEEVADGFVIYDPVRDRVHYCNHTAVLVLELCTGEHAPERIAELVQRYYELPERPDEMVGTCLATLRDQGLVA
jgi:hypothetical protein